MTQETRKCCVTEQLVAGPGFDSEAKLSPKIASAIGVVGSAWVLTLPPSESKEDGKESRVVRLYSDSLLPSGVETFTIADAIIPAEVESFEIAYDGGHIVYVVEGEIESNDEKYGTIRLRAGDVAMCRPRREDWHILTKKKASADPVRIVVVDLIEPQAARRFGRRIESLVRNGSPYLLTSPDGRDGSLANECGLDIYLASLAQGQQVRQNCARGRKMSLLVIKGEVLANGVVFRAADLVLLTDDDGLRVSAISENDLALALLWQIFEV